ncbi:MAG TPA: HNH endonuclease domain-containing protein [Verrucomicrobiae bacterium]
MKTPGCVWSFDLGKGSIGEAVRNGNEFLHRASLLIPPELARRGPATLSGTPANKYRALKTRQAHHERERWLETVWRAAGLTPLQTREVWENPATSKWELKHPADYRLEREFAPKRFRKKDGELVEIKYPNGQASDGAPAGKPEDFELCYNSSLLRIRLLQWKDGETKLAEWQIYKALRAALQQRGYGLPPWTTKEARKQGKLPEELAAEEEKKLQQTDPRYREAADKWKRFRDSVPQPFQLPCYYDAGQMGLWRYLPEQRKDHVGFWNPNNSPDKPPHGSACTDHKAESTRNIRFDRAAVRLEIIALGEKAAAMLPPLRDAFARWKKEGWKFEHPVTGKELTLPVRAESFGEFLCDGPAGKPDETSFEAYLHQRRQAGVRPGSFEEWMAALGQKTPKFDNRILNHCVLIPRYHVCKVDLRLETDIAGKPTGAIQKQSLLASEVTLLLKLKNLLVADAVKGQRKLTVQEVRDILAFAHRRVQSLPLLTPNGELIKEWPKKVADRFGINQSNWHDIAAETEFLKQIKAVTVNHEGTNRPPNLEEAESLLRQAASAKKTLVDGLPAHLQPLLQAARAMWKNARNAADETVLRPMPGHEEVKAPKTSGRSAYSRVALRILKELILSGEAPSVFHQRLIRRDADLLGRLGPTPEKPLMILKDSTAADEEERRQEDTENRKRGLLVSELNFLRQMRKDDAAEDSWENIFVPSQTLDALQQRHIVDGRLDADSAVRELLGTVKDAIVRHRLEVFDGRLRKLQMGDAEEKLPGYGVPDAIVLEFAREDFMGKEALKKYQRFLNERTEERKAARTEAAQLGMESRSAGLRYELFKAQGGICLYTGSPLFESKLDQYEIDHIVPRSLGGPDAVVNYVLTFPDVNHTKEKGKLTPYALLHEKDGWDAYVERVKARATSLRNKKVQLLTREDAPELVERYTALAETAWVSKLAQTIVNLRFGWKNGVDYSGPQPVKRVIVVSGGVTARVRRKYGLDRLLYSDTTDPEVLAKKVKNRDDKRHHALDAMVLTFIPQWARDPNKEGFFRFPAEFRDVNGRENYDQIRELFKKSIAEVMPRHIAYERPALADTNFGCRLDHGKPVIVQRVPVYDLAQKPAGAPSKTKFDLDYLKKQIRAVRDINIQKRLMEEFVAGKNPDEPSWKQFCDSFTQLRKKDGMPGARIVKVWVFVGQADQFKDLSKDQNSENHRGAWRRRKQDHRGQIVVAESSGSFRVLPVYVFESPRQKADELRNKLHEGDRILGFFQSGCLVEVDREVEHRTKPLPPGIYKLRTIREDGYVQLENQLGQTYPDLPLYALSKLVAAGFRRTD